VADLQPWRNPRPAPPLQEIEPRLTSLMIPSWLRSWWPAVLWAVFIFIMSTDTFSVEHTGRIVEPMLRWLFPSWSADQVHLIHHYIRKIAHFSEYFVFCLLLYHGVRGSRSAGWHWTWGLTALLIAAGYSALDEIHQAFVASRTSSAYDSLLDSAGAFVAVGFLWLWFHRPTAKPSRVPS
jgi:VanZ family protein